MFYYLFCRLPLCVCLFLFTSGWVVAQQNDKTNLQARQFQEKGDYFYEFAQYDSCLLYYEKAAAIFKKSDLAAYADVRTARVNALNTIGASEAAYKLLQDNKAFIRNNIGAESPSMIKHYLIASKFYVQQKNQDATNSSLNKSLALVRKLYGKDHIEEANILRLISVRLNDADSAFQTSEKALKILYKNKTHLNSRDAVLVHNSVGTNLMNLSFYNGNAPVTVAGKKFESTLMAAICYFDSAYQKEVNYFKAVTPFAASVLHNLGVCYESVVYVDPAEGLTPFKRSNWNKALEYYDRSNEIGLKKRYEVVPLNMVCKGIVYADMGDLDKALYWYHQGLKFNIKGFTSNNVYELPVVSNIHVGEFTSILLEYKAFAFRDKYAKTKSLKDLEAFYKHALKLAEVLEKMRDESKLYHESKDGPNVASMTENYALAIEACQELYEKTGNKKYISEGFTIAEKFKNHSLLNISQKQKLMQYLKGNQQALDDYKKLSRSVKYFDELVSLQKEHPGLKNVKLFKHAADSLAFYENRFNAFFKDMEVRYPGFYQEKVTGKYVASLQECQELLPNDKTAAVIYIRHYAQREVQPKLYVFVVEKKQTHFLKLDLPQNFDEKTDSLIQTIFKSKLAEYRNSAFEINQLVFEPILGKLSKNVDKLIIMPDGKLWKVPFGALLTAQAQGDDYRKLPYLINDFAIHYAHTATLLKNYTAHNSSVFYQDKVLAMAPFADKQMLSNLLNEKELNLMNAAGKNENYNRLPFTTKLLYKLQKQLPGKFLMDSAATEQYFKQNAGNYSVLHIATHAETDLSDPLNSKLILAKGGEDDGELHMNELFQLNLKPELAVLSACETGVGAIKAGSEGMLSLAWIFNYLGCPSTISSLWKVDDRNTSLLLEKFYDHLADGKSKDVALHLAKLEMMQKARTSEEANPFYWSGFVLVGDAAPLKLSPVPYVTMLVIAGFMLMLIFALMFIFRLRKKRAQQVSTSPVTEV